MWAALFGSQGGSSSGQLTLRPNAGAKQVVAGFRGGDDLVLKTAALSETVGILLDRLNTYRGPDQQIRRVWTLEGSPMSLNTPVRGSLVAEVRVESIGI